MKSGFKGWLSSFLSLVYGSTRYLRKKFTRLYAHSALSADLVGTVPASLVIEGLASIEGTCNIHFGEHVLLYPGLHLETQGKALIDVGDGVVISRGVHIVAMAVVTIGAGSLIGEYASIRDANHRRSEKSNIRDSGHTADPILIGKEVWIGRGVAVLGGVTIGDGATVGANAVVTRDVAPGTTVAGVPAVVISRREITIS